MEYKHMRTQAYRHRHGAELYVAYVEVRQVAPENRRACGHRITCEINVTEHRGWEPIYTRGATRVWVDPSDTPEVAARQVSDLQGWLADCGYQAGA
jgi:hypothetical protein